MPDCSFQTLHKCNNQHLPLQINGGRITLYYFGKLVSLGIAKSCPSASGHSHHLQWDFSRTHWERPTKAYFWLAQCLQNCLKSLSKPRIVLMWSQGPHLSEDYLPLYVEQRNPCPTQLHFGWEGHSLCLFQNLKPLPPLPPLPPVFHQCLKKK